jgi:hypothetical protein
LFCSYNQFIFSGLSIKVAVTSTLILYIKKRNSWNIELGIFTSDKNNGKDETIQWTILNINVFQTCCRLAQIFLNATEPLMKTFGHVCGFLTHAHTTDDQCRHFVLSFVSPKMRRPRCLMHVIKKAFIALEKIWLCHANVVCLMNGLTVLLNHAFYDSVPDLVSWVEAETVIYNILSQPSFIFL